MANRTVVIKDINDFITKIVEKGFSYRQLAKQANTNPTTISLLTKGERNPSPILAVNICKALECNFDDIFFIPRVDNCKQNDRDAKKEVKYG